MAELNKKTRPGDLSTYEDAPDSFFKRRKEDLRSSIRNPHLSSTEFFQNVISHAAVSVMATAWSVWFGAGRFIRDFHKPLHDYIFVRSQGGEKLHFIPDIDKYKRLMQNIVEGSPSASRR